MNLTPQQIKALTGEKCPECKGLGFVNEFETPLADGFECKSCNGTGLPTIEIKKEMVECKCGCHSENNAMRLIDCLHYSCKGKIPKYRVNQTIYYCKKDKVFDNEPFNCRHEIKLKIISETKDKWKIQMVR